MSLRDLAKSVANGTCKLMDGREKVTMDEVLDAYPEGITITAFYMLSGDNGDYPVITFAEDNQAYFFGGKILSDICKKLADEFSGDCEKASEKLLSEGGLPIKMEITETKKHRKFVNVTVLD